MNNDNKNMLDILSQSSTAMAIYTSASLRIGFINNSMINFWTSDHTKSAKQFSELLSHSDHQCLTSLVSDVWNSGQPFQVASFPIIITDKGISKTVYTDWELQPITNATGATESLIHTIRITKDPLLKPYNSNNTVLADEKLKSWSKKLSHDLRNPLSVAKLGMQYMRSRQQLTPEEHKKWVSMVIDALQSVETLITDVVDVSKTNTSSEHATHRVPHLLQTITQEYEPILNLKVVAVSAIVPDIKGDSKTLYQIFNLAVQSVGYGSDSSSRQNVTIKWSKLSDRIQYTLFNDSQKADFQPVGLNVLEEILHKIKGVVVWDTIAQRLSISIPLA